MGTQLPPDEAKQRTHLLDSASATSSAYQCASVVVDVATKAVNEAQLATAALVGEDHDVEPVDLVALSSQS